MKASEKIRQRIATFAEECARNDEVAVVARHHLQWALGLIESEPQPDPWTKCTITPVPRTLVSETRPRWIEVWLRGHNGLTSRYQRPDHIEPIGPFDGNEWRYGESTGPFWSTVVAWRFVTPPEVENG